jgi:hypothetical protein
MRKIQLILAAIGLLGATNLNAQTKPKTEKEKERAWKAPEESCISTNGKTECRVFRWTEDSSMIKRAAIGVRVQTTGTKRDTIGVFIAGVVPDGPAEKAGIVEGERIVSINGVDLRVSAADVEDSYTAGLAAHRLTREIEKLTPGAVVRLQVNSGGRTREVQVTTMRASEVHKLSGNFGMVFPRMPGLPNMQILREHMEPLRMMRGTTGTPRMLAPTRIRVVPGPSKVPMQFNFDDDVMFEAPATPPAPPLAPTPAIPAKPAKISGQFTSII